MNARLGLALVVFAVTFGVCRVAEANSISPYLWFWPGFISVTIIYSFPASVLAAFLERPFLSAGGLGQRPLVLSLRANFLSALVGILVIPVGYPALYTLGPFWCLIAFGLSCAVEIAYLRRFSRQLSWGWVIAGNVVSSSVLMALPPIAFAIKEHHRHLAWKLEPHETWLNGVALVVSLALFAVSFALPVRRDVSQQTAEADDSGPLEPAATDEAPAPEASGQPAAP